MRFAAAWPWWVTLGLAAAFAVAAGWGYLGPHAGLARRRRALLTALRFAVFLVILVLLARPVREEPASADRPAVAVLLDRSRSMGIADAGGERRLDAAVAAIRDDVMPALADDVRVDLWGIGERLDSLDLADVRPEARWSDLTGAVAETEEHYAGRELAAIVLVSDGADTGVGLSDAPAGPPVFTVGVGAREPGRDREVLDVSAGRPAAAGSAVDLAFSTVAHGFDGEPFDVRVLEDGRLIRVVTMDPPADGAVARSVVAVSPKGEGATLYTVEIPLDASERVAGNNARRVLVPPPARPRRVLLVEGGPGYEHSFLKRVLRGDPGIVVDAVVDKGRNDLGERTFYVQGAADRAEALAGGYPATREALFRYDAVILGNVEAARLRPRQVEDTVAFVSERGGGLLVMGARSFEGRGFQGTPLEALLPLALREEGRAGVLDAGGAAGAPARIAPTPDGAGHPILRLGAGVDETAAGWAAMPALGGVVPLGPPRPGAAVLAVAAGESAVGPAAAAPPGGSGGAVTRRGGEPAARPVVAVQRFGRGRAMVFAGEASWRWRMLAPSTDRTYERFWRQTARWLAGGAPDRAELRVGGGRSVGEPLRIDVAAADERFAPLTGTRVRVRVRSPEGEEWEQDAPPRPGEPGRYAAEVAPRGRGVHRVTAVVERDGGTLEPAGAAVLVGGADPELSEPRRHDRVLRGLAEATGGRAFDLDGVGGLAAAVRAGLGPPPAPVVRDAWDTVWAFLLIAGLLSAEWGLRRRWGLR